MFHYTFPIFLHHFQVIAPDTEIELDKNKF